MIIAVVAIDLLLAGVNWRMAASGRAPKNQLAMLRREHALMAADLARAQRIQQALPAVEQQCDTFFKQNLRPAGSGYSSLVSDLGTLAQHAGLRADDITFRQHTADKRGVVEVEIGAAINGDYPSVVRFIDGLEHSDTFYVLDGLTLAAGSAGQLRLNLQLRTFFRS